MATDWRRLILDEFPPDIPRPLTLAGDADGLLFDESLSTALRERGYELLPFDDAIEFRYIYETRYRKHWQVGEPAPNVILHATEEEVEHLPYDLQQAGHAVTLDVGKLFPGLSYPVVRALEPSHLDALWQAQSNSPPKRMGDNATKDYILRYVFDLDHQLAHNAVALLHLLLVRHVRSDSLPYLLQQRLVDALRCRAEFAEWPLERLICDREAFLEFLQERWPQYVQETEPGVGVSEKANIYVKPVVPGPTMLPFGHENVRVYIDSLFLEGKLEPVRVYQLSAVKQSWIRAGIYYELRTERLERLRRLLRKLDEEIPNAVAHHAHWQQFAMRWAEVRRLEALANEDLEGKDRQHLVELQGRVDEAFIDWLHRRYGSLVHLPPAPPVMLHHVPRWLARRLHEGKAERIALLVLDGLALDQWFTMRDELQRQRPEWVIREQVLFAWLPTLTTVSRQALFGARPPLYFADSLDSTSRELKHWQRFWTEEGLGRYEIGYRKALGGQDTVPDLAPLLGGANRVLGLVIDTVDRIMHGMQLGNAGMHSQILQWVNTGILEQLIENLHQEGYRVVMTSDHGNVEALGIGRPSEGAVADYRGERARIFSDEGLRKRVQAQFPASESWPATGLPENFQALFAPERKAFVLEGNRVVAHGGPSLEEVMVPLVEVDCKELNGE